MAEQLVRQILYLGPAPDDDTSVVVTAVLSCGCRVTRTLSERRVRTLAGGQSEVRGEVDCPKGHPSPPSLQRPRKSTLISRALAGV